MADDAIIIEYAGAPVAKGRPRLGTINGQARAFTPTKTRKAEASLAFACQQAMAGRAPLEGPLSLHLTVRLPVPRSWSKKKQREALAGRVLPTSRPDWDNFAKLFCDSANLVVFRDDSQIVDAHVLKRYDERPGLRIVIEPIVTDDPADAPTLDLPAK